MEATLFDLLNQKGSTWATRADLKKALEKAKVKDEIASAVAENKIICSKKDNDFIFTLPEFFNAENTIVQNYYRLQNETEMNNDMLFQLVEEAQNKLGLKLHEQQINGITTAILNNVSIITGGAGTGKTSVLLALMYCLKKIKPDTKFALTAPTGKASRRMSEATGMPASTLHKKLGLTETKARTDFFDIADVIIVDEFSMVDLLLAEQLFRAVKTGAKLIMVGDINQLSSVGIGTVLKSLINSGLPLTQLTKTFRQDDNSFLFKNITAIKNGGKLESGEDFHIYKNNGNPQKTLIDLYNYKCKEYGRENVVILLPYRKVGDTCTEAINRIVQSQVQKNSNNAYCCIVDNLHSFYVGDPVIQMENREVANGEVGKVLSADENGISVLFDDCTIEYDREEILSNLSLAYAITIHKSQGSEYPCVICTCLDSELPMQSKNLLYTAVTRAKKECNLICDLPALSQALQKVEDSQRLSMLEDKFKYARNCRNLKKQALKAV